MNYIAGLELFISTDLPLSLSLSLLQKRGNKIGSEKHVSGLTAIASLKEHLPAGVPVVLSIGGKSVLHKKLGRMEEGKEDRYLQQVLPNALADDFYVQCSPAAGDKVFVSVARRSLVDPILKELQEAGLDVVGCSLGPFVVTTLLPLMNVSAVHSQLLVPGFWLLVSEDGIEEIKASQEKNSIRVGDEAIGSDNLVSFASALSYFIAPSEPFIPAVAHNKEEFRQKSIFKRTLKAALAACFALLLANYLLFDHFWKKQNELGSRFSLNQEALAELEKLKAEVAGKEKFFERTGLLEGSRTSFYADRLVAGMPERMRLSQLNIHPRLKKEEEELVFAARTLELKGFCRTSTELNNWMQEMKKKEWVSGLTLLNYSQDKNRESGEFNIELKLN